MSSFRHGDMELTRVTQQFRWISVGTFYSVCRKLRTNHVGASVIGVALRSASIILLACFFFLQSCNSPFQVKEVYTPQLVVYGIVFRGDSTVRIRVQTDSKNPIANPNQSN